MEWIFIVLSGSEVWPFVNGHDSCPKWWCFELCKVQSFCKFAVKMCLIRKNKFTVILWLLIKRIHHIHMPSYVPRQPKWNDASHEWRALGRLVLGDSMLILVKMTYGHVQDPTKEMTLVSSGLLKVSQRINCHASFDILGPGSSEVNGGLETVWNRYYDSLCHASILLPWILKSCIENPSRSSRFSLAASWKGRWQETSWQSWSCVNLCECKNHWWLVHVMQLRHFFQTSNHSNCVWSCRVCHVLLINSPVDPDMDQVNGTHIANCQLGIQCT